MNFKKLTAEETRRMIARDSTRVRKLAAQHGLSLHKARRGFCFGFELRDGEGKRVYGDEPWGFNRTLAQCERFLTELAKEKAPPEGDALAGGVKSPKR